jgi:hypothetical protein
VLATAVNRRIDDAALGFLHEAAYSLAFDGYHRFGGAYELEAGLLASHVRGDTMAIRRTQMAPGHYFQRPDATHLSLDPSRTALSGASAHARLARISGSWKWGLTGSATSPGFETSDLGFNPELDHVHSSAWLRYEDYSPGRVFRSWNVGTMQMVNADTDGRLREWTQDLGFNFQLLNYWSGGVWVMRHAGAWAVHHLRGGPALRKPGRWMGSLDVGSDGREAVSGNGFMFWEVEDETDGRLLSVNATVSVRPTERLSLRVGPALSVGRQAWQYVGEREVGSAGIRYLVGGLDQRTLSLTTRLDYTLSAALSLQVYTRPFIATVEYDAFREVADAGATGFSDRFRAYGFTRTKRAGADLLSFDRDGDGATDLEMSDPSFALSSIQMNTVLRWEYRAGSTLYAVWTHDRDVLGRDRYALGDNLQALRTAPANDIFMLKLSYWLGR